MIGLSAVRRGRPARTNARVMIVLALGIAVAAIAVAFGVLRTFSWT